MLPAGGPPAVSLLPPGQADQDGGQGAPGADWGHGSVQYSKLNQIVIMLHCFVIIVDGRTIKFTKTGTNYVSTTYTTCFQNQTGR